MEEMPSLNMSVQRLKVAILSLDLPCYGPLTNSGEILTTGKSHGPLKRRQATWDRNGSTRGPNPWKIYDDDDDDDDDDVKENNDI